MTRNMNGGADKIKRGEISPEIPFPAPLMW